MSGMKSTRFPEPKRARMVSSPNDRSASMSANQTTATRPAARDGFASWACNRAIAAVVESILHIASRTLRRPDQVWFSLNDHLLADIGETRAEAGAEAARCVWHTPLETMADRVISQDLAKPRLPSSRFD
jgi:hypothetical protein